MLENLLCLPVRQEALLCERARESDVRVTSVVRVHVCGAELCAHTATEAFGLMAPAMETRINGGYAKDTKPKNENKHTGL